ncbi:MAG: hemerythrin domain-containing protein [Bryobacteraceae bacterium]
MLRDSSLIPLSHQHHNALALCVMTERELRQDSSEAAVRRLAQRAVDRFDIELVNHFEIEEGDLFPAIDRELGRLAIVGELIAEHRQIEGLIARLRTGPSAALLVEFTSLLRRHIRREENELFQDIQQRLPRSVLDEVGRAIDARAARVCLGSGQPG